MMPQKKHKKIFVLSYREKKFYDVLTRIFNFFAAGIGLVVLLPVMLLAGIAIKLTSRGPALYKGKRVGKDGRVFTAYKLRTMIAGAERMIGPRVVTPQDSVYTRIGPMLRNFRLDEIPQLYNVLRGDMNLIGPRPEPEDLHTRYVKEVPNYLNRLKVKPGISGIAQVRGGFYTHPRNKLKFDILYINNRSFWLDMKLIFLTFLRLATKLFTGTFFAAWMFILVSLLSQEKMKPFIVNFMGHSINVIYLFPLFVLLFVLLRIGVGEARILLFKTPADWVWLGFMLIAFLSVPFSAHTVNAFRGAVYYLCTGGLVFYLFVNSRLSSEHRKRTISFVVLIAGFIAMYGFVEYGVHALEGLESETIGGLSTYRISTTLGNPALTSAYFTAVIPLAFSRAFIEEDPEWRIFWWVCAIGITFGMLLTFTRTGIIAVTISLLVFFWRFSRVMLIPTLIGAFAVIVVLSAGRDERLKFGAYSADAIKRLKAEKSCLGTLEKENFIFGVGVKTLDAYLSKLNEKSNPGFHSSNMYLRLFIETGIVGFLFFMLIILFSMKTIFKCALSSRFRTHAVFEWGIFCGIIGLGIYFFAFNGLNFIALEVLWWGLLGMGMGIALKTGSLTRKYYRVVDYREALQHKLSLAR